MAEPEAAIAKLFMDCFGWRQRPKSELNQRSVSDPLRDAIYRPSTAKKCRPYERPEEKALI